MCSLNITTSIKSNESNAIPSLCPCCRTIHIHNISSSVYVLVAPQLFLTFQLVFVVVAVVFAVVVRITVLQAKTTKKIVLRLECKDCKQKFQIALKRTKHFELGAKKN